MLETKYTPCIILPGIGQSKVASVDKDGNKIKMAWPLDVNGEEILGSLKASLMKMMVFRKDAGFSDKVKSIVKDILQPIAVNDDGTMKNGVRVVKYNQSLAQCNEKQKNYIYKMVPMQRLSAIIGEENLYFFAYNSFGEPYETAKDLDEFIQKVKKERNCEKVNLVPVSLGGALSTAYFDAYGHKNDVERVMYFVAALEGTRLIADVYRKNIRLGELTPVIEMFASKSAAEKARSLLKMLPDGVIENVVDKAIDALLEEVAINCPSLWSVLPPEDYEELSAKYLSDKKHAVLREKTDRFYNAQSNIRKIIDERKANGTEFFSIACYGLELVPVIQSFRTSSDTIINIESPSLGAKAAPLGEKLPTDHCRGTYCTNEAHSHISPDGTIDASYGYMPEHTWYFLNQQHDATAYNDTALNIAAKVLSDKNFKDIYSDESLPQFGIAHDNRH